MLGSALLLGASAAGGAPSPPEHDRADRNDDGWHGAQAVGDGRTDDHHAFQSALNAIAATGRSGTLRLSDGKAYKLDRGITIDTSFVSIAGDALLDFTGLTGPSAAITIICSRRSEYNGSDGYKAALRGNIVVKGPGKHSTTVGIDCNSPNAYTAAQMLFEGINVGRFGTGIRFSNRGYNNLFIKCDINENGIGVDWPAEGLDNDERNSLIGCVIYNNDIAVRNYNAASTLELISCSVDYNAIDYDIQYGRIVDFGSHHESVRWSDRPYRCNADPSTNAVAGGAVIFQVGGTIVNQNSQWEAHHVVDTGKDGVVKLRDVFANNMLLTPLTGKPSTWASGSGRFELTGLESFNAGSFPLRLCENTTSLADPDFEAPSLGRDMIWRTADTVDITTRHGKSGIDNLVLSRVMVDADNGKACLSASKAGVAGTSAQFVLIALPVRVGDKVLAGFKVRADPARPGIARAFDTQLVWAKIDGQDSNRIPIVARADIFGIATIMPTTSAYQLVTVMRTMENIVVPAWDPTHFLMYIDMAAGARNTLLFDNLWADRC